MSLPDLIKWLILPPTAPMLLILAGLVLWRRLAGRLLAAFGLLLLYAASTPLVAYPLIDALQHEPFLTEGDIRDAGAGAIVVLGAGRRLHAPEYGGETINEYALERLRYAARLQRLTGLPIIPTGGVGPYDDRSGAALMRETLRDDFAAVVPWAEEQAGNTMENARFVARGLRGREIRRVFVVTHALHMPRALWCFGQTELEAIPAPTGFISTAWPESWPLLVLPRASVLESTWLAVHEGLGRLWYRIRY
mgnify:CR=1 FL=1